jgi:hypothetical protein
MMSFQKRAFSSPRFSAGACAAFCLLAVLAAGSPPSARAQRNIPLSSPDAGSLEDLGWMAGSWRTEVNGQLFEEMWLPPRDGSMAGVARTKDANGQMYVVFMAVQADRKKGLILMTTDNPGRPWTEFKVADATRDRFVAENPKNAMPRRIEYLNEGANALVARKTGQIGPTPLGTEFRFERIPEQAPAAAPANASASAADPDAEPEAEAETESDPSS